jgi:hypothetical protein
VEINSSKIPGGEAGSILDFRIGILDLTKDQTTIQLHPLFKSAIQNPKSRI